MQRELGTLAYCAEEQPDARYRQPQRRIRDRIAFGLEQFPDRVEHALICRRQKKRVKFFATETRPYLQGARLTAWELKRSGCDVTLIPDNAVAKTMTDKKITCVLVGSDRSARNGDFANKVGTYQIALLARHFNIPFYALVQPSQRLASGRDIPIEVRSDDEILTFEGRRLGSKLLQAYYPGFDVVPARLVTQHIAINVRS